MSITEALRRRYEERQLPRIIRTLLEEDLASVGETLAATAEAKLADGLFQKFYPSNQPAPPATDLRGPGWTIDWNDSRPSTPYRLRDAEPAPVMRFWSLGDLDTASVGEVTAIEAAAAMFWRELGLYADRSLLAVLDAVAKNHPAGEITAPSYHRLFSRVADALPNDRRRAIVAVNLDDARKHLAGGVEGNEVKPLLFQEDLLEIRRGHLLTEACVGVHRMPDHEEAIPSGMIYGGRTEGAYARTPVTCVEARQLGARRYVFRFETTLQFVWRGPAVRGHVA